MRTRLLVAFSLVLATAAALPAQRPVREPAANVRPRGPATVTAVVTGPGGILVRWDSVPGATTYHVGFHAPPDGWRRATTVDGRTREFVHTGRDLTRSHQYQVVAVVGDLASLPTRSAVLEPRPAQADTATTPVTTPATTAPADTAKPATIRTSGENSCTVQNHSLPDRVYCTGPRKDWTPYHSGDEFVTATCPDGYKVVAGGHNTLLWNTAEIRWSLPMANSRGWHVWIQVRGDPARRNSGFARADALCERIQ